MQNLVKARQTPVLPWALPWVLPWALPWALLWALPWALLWALLCAVPRAQAEGASVQMLPH